MPDRPQMRIRVIPPDRHTECAQEKPYEVAHIIECVRCFGSGGQCRACSDKCAAEPRSFKHHLENRTDQFYTDYRNTKGAFCRASGRRASHPGERHGDWCVCPFSCSASDDAGIWRFFERRRQTNGRRGRHRCQNRWRSSWSRRTTSAAGPSRCGPLYGRSRIPPPSRSRRRRPLRQNAYESRRASRSQGTTRTRDSVIAPPKEASSSPNGANDESSS